MRADMPIDRLQALSRLVGRTPLLEIHCRYRGREQRVYAKHEAYNFTGSIKDRMALYILERAYADGTIKPIKEGDTVFFPGHQIVRWHIPVYLKKVALQTPEISIPRQIAHRVPFAKRIVRKVRSVRAAPGAPPVG